MERLPVLANVVGLGEVVESCSDFYTELQQLEANRASLISPRDEAYARLQTKGKENIGRIYGTRTTAGFEYVKDQLPIFRVNSRLNAPNLAKLAVEANRSGRYFSTETKREYEDSLRQVEEDKSKKPVDRSVIVLPSRDHFIMSDKENWEVLETILKDQAKSYFELNGPITVYPVDKDVVDAQSGTILNYLWFRVLDGRSDLDGYDGCLDACGRARGVRKVSTEGAQQNSLLPYTSKQIEEELERLSRLEAEIQKSREFLSSLKQ